MSQVISLRPNPVRVPSYDLALVDHWIARSELPDVSGGHAADRGWTAFLDEDGAICLVPRDCPEPAFAITADPDGFVVLVCDPEDYDELGPFDTVRTAIAGITGWLALPVRVI